MSDHSPSSAVADDVEAVRKKICERCGEYTRDCLCIFDEEKEPQATNSAVLQKTLLTDVMKCFDCAAQYSSLGVDVALPDQQWKTLFPEESGVLCANCICLRARKHGGTALLAWVDNIVHDNHGRVKPSEQGVNSPATSVESPDTGDLERLRLEVKARGEVSEALHEIAMWCFDLTLTCMTTDGVSDDIRRRARAAHTFMLKYRQQYDLRSRAEVETGQWDLAIDSPNYEAFSSPASSVERDKQKDLRIPGGV